MSSPLQNVVIVMICLGLITSVLVVGSISGVGASTTQSRPSQPAIDTTVTHIHVYENGTAEWEIEMRTRLETDSEVDAYRNFQSAFRNNTSAYLASFETQMRTVVTESENTTNRTMNATGFRGTTSVQTVPRRWGVVTYRFQWDGFAEVTGHTIAVGDAFESGYYLGENDVLTMHAPPAYEITQTEPEPKTSTNQSAVTWAGPLDFNDQQPAVVFSPTPQLPSPPNNSTTDPNISSPPSNVSDRFPIKSGVLVTGLGIVVVVLAGVWYHRGRESGQDENASAADGAGADADVSPESQADSDSGETQQTHEYLTDSERVLQLLDDKGGRIPQAKIGDELDWSDSKTSRVLSEMVEADQVQKLKLGRKNLIELPDDKS